MQPRHDDFLGQGPAFPFRTGPAGAPDFQLMRGADSVQGAVDFLLLTARGDLMFDPGLGLDFDRYRHRANDADAEADVIMDIRESLSDAEPRMRNIRPSVERDTSEKIIEIGVLYALITQQVPNNRVLLPTEAQRDVTRDQDDSHQARVGLLDATLLGFQQDA